MVRDDMRFLNRLFKEWESAINRCKLSVYMILMNRLEVAKIAEGLEASSFLGARTFDRYIDLFH